MDHSNHNHWCPPGSDCQNCLVGRKREEKIAHDKEGARFREINRKNKIKKQFQIEAAIQAQQNGPNENPIVWKTLKPQTVPPKQHGRWGPCVVCKGCNDEFAKKPPFTGAPIPPEEYCSAPVWMPSQTPVNTPKQRGWVAKKRVKKLTKKAQLWANYHKQQDDIKIAKFFEPRKRKPQTP